MGVTPFPTLCQAKDSLCPIQAHLMMKCSLSAQGALIFFLQAYALFLEPSPLCSMASRCMRVASHLQG